MQAAAASVYLRLREVTLARYFIASVGALAVDVCCFLTLLTLSAPATLASAAGYSFGILAHWLMSSRAVFVDAVAQPGAARTWQKALFVVSAFIGLGLTTSIVGLGTLVGLDPRLAKLVAIPTSFAANWLMRSRIVFRA